MTAQRPLAARIGLGLVAIGIFWFGAWALWAATRIWAPLKMPVSLSQGHIRTAQFKINLEGFYELYFEFDNGSATRGVRCPSQLPRTSWSLSKEGRIVAEGKGGGNESMGGFFTAAAGSYTVDLDVQDGGSCLNAWSPRLIVAAFESQHPEVGNNLVSAFFLSLVFGITGLFIRSRSHEDQLDSLTEPGPQRPLTRRALDPPRPAAIGARKTARRSSRMHPGKSYLWPFQKASWFGLIGACVWLFPLVTLCVFGSARVTPTGLVVHLVRPGIAAKAQPGLEPLLIRVEFEDCRVVRNLYIGSQRVPSGDFDKTLRKGLALRPPTWPVYVEGDSDLDWGYVAKAIDEIRALNAEVVLLTRRRSTAKPSCIAQTRQH